MKVLLVQPPIEDFYTTPIRNYPLGLLFIASNIVDICDVEIVDLRQKKKKVITSPFYHLSEIYNDRESPFSLFSRYYHFGLCWEEIEKIISEKKPQIIGISANFSTYFDESLKVAKIAKETDSSIITVLGGNYPTLFPDEVLSKDFVDFVIRGEGETTFRMLIEKLKKGNVVHDIPGLCYRSKSGVIVKEIFTDNNTKLNLERSLLKKENYRYGKGYVAPVLTSRGCPYNCSFCGKPPVKFRFYNVDDVKKDIEKLLNLGFDTIDFEDDYFDITSPRIQNILTWLVGKDLKLTAMNGMVPKIDYESKKLIKEAGFQRINISLVDYDEEIRKFIERGHFNELDNVIDTFIDSEVPIEVHFIIGMPEQSKEKLVDTIIYLAEKKVLLGPSVYYLSPGSKIFENYIKEMGMIDFKNARSSALFQVNKEFCSITLSTFMRLTRFVNYIKSVVDKWEKDFTIKELKETVSMQMDLEGPILKALVEEKKFISFDKKQKDFKEDPIDKEVVERFFEKLNFIVGYKTKNVCNFK